MIIKSMSRKSPHPQDVRQLVDYITRDNEGYIAHNFFAHQRDTLTQEFIGNIRLLSKRKNGNYYYHEIISITRSSKISESLQKQYFETLIREYIASRCPDCMVLAGLHDEKDNNLHYHVMISANKVGEKNRFRLPKHVFGDVAKGLENYANTRFPELEQGRVIDKPRDPDKPRISHREAELKKRTKQPSKKDQIRAFVREMLNLSRSKMQFSALLEAKGFRLEERGKKMRVIDTEGKPHRLHTLGIAMSYKALDDADTAVARPGMSEKTRKDHHDTPEEAEFAKSGKAHTMGDDHARSERHFSSEQIRDSGVLGEPDAGPPYHDSDKPNHDMASDDSKRSNTPEPSSATQAREALATLRKQMEAEKQQEKDQDLSR